jgi:subtilisin family serine protease
MNPFDLVKLTQLMERSSGAPEVLIGLIDGPVAVDHPDLAYAHIREIPGKRRGICAITNSAACTHGTFVAGVLSAGRNSSAPAICPGCTLLVRPIFAESMAADEQMPSATAEELVAAIFDCVEAGVQVINLSVALVQAGATGQRRLNDVLDYAIRRGVIVVAAAGNQGQVGSTIITRHPWIIPIVACDRRGLPLSYSNLGNAIGRRGLCAPGDRITSISVSGQPMEFSGTSVATPFVTGAIALLWSEFPNATAAEVKFALTQATVAQRPTVVPPLLNAWGAYQALKYDSQRKMI